MSMDKLTVQSLGEKLMETNGDLPIVFKDETGRCYEWASFRTGKAEEEDKHDSFVILIY